MSKKVELESALLQFAKATAKPPYLFDLGPEKGRKTVDAVQSGDIKKLSLDIQEKLLVGGPGGSVSIKLLRPQNVSGNLPVILYIHGAGWVFGNSHTHDRLIRELAVGVEACVVFPHYSLSSEAKYPTALEEIYTALQWIAVHGKKNGLDTERLYVAGDSVGGNMTTAITLLSKERKGPAIHKQLLFYPVTDAGLDTESYEQFATKEQLQGLPPALIITAEADVLRDEGEAYANKLREAGVHVTAVRFQGTIHDFVMLNALTDTAAARGAIALVNAWLKD